MSHAIQTSFSSLTNSLPTYHPQILTLKEAKLLFEQLKPGSRDYLKLQDLFLKAEGIFTILIKNTVYKINTLSDSCQLLGGFGCCEHEDIGKNIILRGIGKGESILIASSPEAVNPSHPLHFSDIVTLAGDFYAVPGQAISLPGGGTEEKEKRFLAAFSTLERGNIKQLKDILDQVKEESPRRFKDTSLLL